jgi:hypothetical protein
MCCPASETLPIGVFHSSAQGFVKVKKARLRFKGLSAMSLEEMISVLE